MPFDKKNRPIYILLVVGYLFFLSCSVLKTTYKVTKGTVETTYKVAKGTIKTTYKVTKFAGKTVYQIGKYTFVVIMAPLRSIPSMICRQKRRSGKVASKRLLMSSGANGMSPCL
jgi:hypothetical protein